MGGGVGLPLFVSIACLPQVIIMMCYTERIFVSEKVYIR